MVAQLTKLAGLGNHLWIEVDGHAVRPIFDGGRDEGPHISAVQRVRFPNFGPMAAALASGVARAALVFDHPHYSHRQELGAAVCRALAKDLQEP